MRKLEFLLACSLIAAAAFGARKPDWVQKRPVNPAFYVGIGVAQKAGENRDYIQQAKNAALSDLSSEITVNISSELVATAVEQSGLSEEQVRQEIKATTQSELEDYELMDTWEDRSEYWVYYRLSKSLYAAKKQARLDNAVSLASDLYGNGQERQAAADLAGALQYYFQAYTPIQKYVAEPLETTYRGRTIYLKNELYTAIQSALAGVELVPVREKMEATTGRPLKQPAEVKAVRHAGTAAPATVMNLPVSFEFLRGNGELLREVRTDRSGLAASRVTRITAPDKIQIIRARVDLAGLVNLDSTTAMLRGIISGLSIPETRILLNVSGLKVYVSGKESNFGSALDVAYVEPVLKKALADRGFSFTDNMADADYVIEYDAGSRKGSVVYGQHVAYVDLNISVLDLQSGEEIYKQSFPEVKGIHLDYDRAGLKAFQKAGEEVTRDFVPAFLAKIGD